MLRLLDSRTTSGNRCFLRAKEGREEEKKQGGRKDSCKWKCMGLQTIPSHKAVQKKHCEGLRPLQPCPSCRQGFARAGLLWVACFQGNSDGGVEKLMPAFRALAKNSHSAHKNVPFPVSLWHRDPPAFGLGCRTGKAWDPQGTPPQCPTCHEQPFLKRQAAWKPPTLGLLSTKGPCSDLMMS